jgi:hypothetical protein
MVAILRGISMIRSSSRIISVAIDVLIGEMEPRFGSISARHMGHVLTVCSDFNKHDVQNL